MMSQASMKAQLVALPDVLTEAEACAGWAAAYAAYFANAAAGGIPAGSLTAAKAAMSSGLAGLSSAGAASVQRGITAFWASLSGAPALAFAGAISITPPAGLSGLATTLASVFAANVAASADADTARDAVATALHAASAGGTATIAGSPPAVFPII